VDADEATIKKPRDHDESMQKLLELFPDLHHIPFQHYHTTGSVDLVEIGNVVTKINMIRDHRAYQVKSKNRAFFYLEDTLRNM
jgi:hypothetical protein